MKLPQNVWFPDRFLRIITSEIILGIAYFWTYGLLQYFFYGVGIILVFTAISGFCPAYLPFSFNTVGKAWKSARSRLAILLISVLTIWLAGGYASIFFTKKFFIEDYNAMNGFYKQTLFYSGKEMRAETIANYNALIPAYGIFLSKYSQYQPFSFRHDANFVPDIMRGQKIVLSIGEKVQSGNLKEVHIQLEGIRPIFQDILKRNGFSMLAVTLVDFHDSMEKVIAAADLKDAKWLLNTYVETDEKLKAVELEANDAEIVEIRTNLEKVKVAAEKGESETLSKLAADLKSSFVKVYLKRG